MSVFTSWRRVTTAIMEPSDRKTSNSSLAQQPPLTDAKLMAREPETSLPPNAANSLSSSGMQWFVDEFSKPEYQWLGD